MAMAYRYWYWYRFFILLFFVFSIACSAARNTVFISGEEIDIAGIRGRSLEVKLNDYGETSANTGHDPRNRGGSGRGGGGRRTP